MSLLNLETPRLTLKQKSIDELKAMLSQMSPEDRSQISPEWVQQIEQAESSNLWLHGFTIYLNKPCEPVGHCGFKGPPNQERLVEIAYGIDPEHQNQGYATEAARALFDFAISHSDIDKVIAHTLPEKNASTQVLGKCGFEFAGEHEDPEDGTVWRWEKPKPELAVG